MKSISEQLQHARPRKVFSRRWSQRSSVALVLDSDNLQDASLLLIKRAEREGDPWSGHMAFPGGRADKVDRNGLSTAKREMFEEVGFDAEGQEHASQLIARLSDVRAARRVIPKAMVVSPYVFLVPEQPPLQANYEVAEIVWVPMTFFAELANRETYAMKYKGMNIKMPCYRYGERVVWGLTLSIIDEMLRLLGYSIPRWHRG